MNWTRTIVAAVDPMRRADDCAVLLKVWFEELAEPVMFIADPFDCETHGKELWIRAMAGEYGPVRIVDDLRPDLRAPVALLEPPRPPRRMLTHDR